MNDQPGLRNLRFAIIGAGMSGIASAIKLIESGQTDFTVYEKADRVGGTWRENTYPGVTCDVPSHLYRYAFSPNPNWSHMFSPGDEIERYFESVANDYDVNPYIRFNDEVTSCVFKNAKWHIATRSGLSDEVDVVIAATGVLHHPNYPEIDGLRSFKPPMFHSARWDHSVDLDDARVGVIGTGSTAVQIVSAIIDQVRSLSLFQRTAQWILPISNPDYSEEEKESFRKNPERMRETYEFFSKMFTEGFADAVVDADSPQMKAIEEACVRNLEDNVHDPELRERLRPDYRAACKRLIVSASFYDSIQKPNAHLVTEGIERIEESGVRTRDGQLHELDVLVLATGFKADAFMRPMKVSGRDGVELSDVWAKRPNAYLSISIPDFPNFFMLNGPNGPVGNFSLIEVAELQIDYVMQLVDTIRSRRCREISATKEAMDTLDAARIEAAKQTVWTTGCHSWYLDDRGVPANWTWTFERFREVMAKPDLGAYEFVG
ncbi:MAG: flavin-containing monooxygenase [Acidimicrobiales bacterium]